MTVKITPALLCVIALVGCATAPPPPPESPVAAPSVANLESTFDGRCFAQTAPQVVTKIVTEQVMVIPETVSPDGSITSPPVFRNQTRPVSETLNPGIRFETLCESELTFDRVATLQRALKARLAYDGPITGIYDAATGQAVQAFQKGDGFDSPQLARSVGQRLGIVAFELDPISPPPSE